MAAHLTWIGADEREIILCPVSDVTVWTTAVFFITQDEWNTSTHEHVTLDQRSPS